ncbi:MAG: hypothetical protein M5U28_27880 [Sandaracinaceae bacterium]|nr:hypothetical protein [Sandaracinaceae bacterium]
MVEAVMKLDARARLDALAGLAANADVRTALRQANGRRAGEAVPDELAARLRAKLVELNTQLDELRGDLVFAVDGEGSIVAAIAPGRIPPGAGLGRFPLVARALEGHVRDDVWVYNDSIYRMAARPVIEGGQYVGAIIHGKRFDDEFARRLSSSVGNPTIGFFHGETMVAGHMPAEPASSPRREEVGQPLAEVLTNESFLAGEVTDPVELSTGGLAVYSLVTGTARRAHVGYAIARPVPAPILPLGLVTDASKDSWMQVLGQWQMWAPVLAIGLLFAMFCVWLERDRPLGRLRRASAGLTGSPENRFTVTDFGGAHRKIAQAVNDALDQAAAAGGGGPKRKAANLDEILRALGRRAVEPRLLRLRGERAAGRARPAARAGRSPAPAGGLPASGGGGLAPPAPSAAAKPLRPGLRSRRRRSPRPRAGAGEGRSAEPPRAGGARRAAARRAAARRDAGRAAARRVGRRPGPATGQRKQLKRTLLGVPRRAWTTRTKTRAPRWSRASPRSCSRRAPPRPSAATTRTSTSAKCSRSSSRRRSSAASPPPGSPTRSSWSRSARTATRSSAATAPRRCASPST